MTIELAPLPYERNALEPHISEETLDYHYGKHHQGYVNKLNATLEKSDKPVGSLEDIIREEDETTFNNAAQVWNHSFYWSSMSPSGGGKPTGALAAAIDSDFGSFESFKQEFTKAAAGNFASGWTWLVKNQDGGLTIVNTDDAETPLTQPDLTPLLTVDVWEHAYYIDRRNDRGAYLSAFWELVNWEFANSNFG